VPCRVVLVVAGVAGVGVAGLGGVVELERFCTRGSPM